MQGWKYIGKAVKTNDLLERVLHMGCFISYSYAPDPAGDLQPGSEKDAEKRVQRFGFFDADAGFGHSGHYLFGIFLQRFSISPWRDL